MEYIGKGIGTIGIWASLAAIVIFKGGHPVAIIVGYVCGVIGTVAIWAPDSFS